MLPDISLDGRYLITDNGTSDGTQIKYFVNNKWYKIDRYGGEGVCEELVSHILKLSNFDPDEYVSYESIRINGEDGCVSNNFLNENDSFITLYRLHFNIYGTDPALVTSKMDYDDAIEYILNFVKANTKVDISTYLANTFVLDALILNEDRHFNNLGLIYDGTEFRPAPIFDNGKSLFIGNKNYDPQKNMSENKNKAFAKAFSGSFELNRSFLESKASLKPNIPAIKKYLRTKDLKTDTVYSRLYNLC
ncbi:MAG: hypothetical protein KBG42_07685 [Lachnospiraceae bacterium]|nr:hypothetical protein [Lachnospiraceae bacterium]